MFSFLRRWCRDLFSNSLNSSSSSLIASSNLLTKVYFPRLIIPVAPVFAKLVDFGIAFVLLLAMLLWFRIRLNAGILMLPYLIIVMMATAAGMGMWLTALFDQIPRRAVRDGIQRHPVDVRCTGRLSGQCGAAAISLVVQLVSDGRCHRRISPALLGTVPMPWNMIAVGSSECVGVVCHRCDLFSQHGEDVCRCRLMCCRQALPMLYNALKQTQWICHHRTNP